MSPVISSISSFLSRDEEWFGEIVTDWQDGRTGGKWEDHQYRGGGTSRSGRG